MIFRSTLILTVATLGLVQAQPVQFQKLRFKVSGNGLPDKDNFGTTDPYVELYYTENGGTKEKKFGRSDTISDTENPSWGNIFEFDFDRSRAQRWHLKVYDHDNGREDDTVGKAWVIVEDFVDRGQVYTVNLHKKGTLTLKSVDPVPVSTQAPAIQPVQPIQQVQQPLAPAVVQPAVQPAPVIVQQPVPVAPSVVYQAQPQKLRFKLSARGLPDTDLIGTIDPYIKAYYTDERTSADTQFGRTAPVNDNENPNFSEVLEFEYVPGKKQRWHFLILDDDENRRDDEGGQGYLDVESYVNGGQNSIVSLAKGQLIVQRA